MIAAGEIELTAAEGQRLAQYVEHGGTLLVADAHLTGPGVAALKLPAAGAAGRGGRLSLARRQRRCSLRSASAIEPIRRREPSRPLATTPDGKVVLRRRSTAARAGSIYLSVPRGLGIDQAGHPGRCRG